MKEHIQVDDEKIVVKRLYVFDEKHIQKIYKLINGEDDLPFDWDALLPAIKMDARVSINNSPFINYSVDVDHGNDQIHLNPHREHLITLCQKYSKGSWLTSLEAIDDHFDDVIYERLVTSNE